MPEEPRQLDSGRLERLILSADASARYYAALGDAHDRGRDLFAGIVALLLAAVAWGSASTSLAAGDLPTDLVLVVLLAAMATLLAWRRSLPVNRYHRLSVEWRVQSFSLKRHRRTQADLSSSDRHEALSRLELDGLALRRSCAGDPEPWLRSKRRPDEAECSFVSRRQVGLSDGPSMHGQPDARHHSARRLQSRL